MRYKKTFETHDLVQGVTDSGIIDQVPASNNTRQVRFGFECVTSTGSAGNEMLFVAFQRE